MSDLEDLYMSIILKGRWLVLPDLGYILLPIRELCYYKHFVWIVIEIITINL